MFGNSQKKVEAAAAAVREEYRQKALTYFNTQIQYMNGSGALAWLRGGLELAQEAGILTTKEIDRIDKIGAAKFEANQKAQREERERLTAQRKAERAAKAAAAKNSAEQESL